MEQKIISPIANSHSEQDPLCVLLAVARVE